ncbi:A/G-specific adenine glycosylase [Pleomorphomonas carboxyditropha]|uniref:Adenine DNA glycosylase n=1 Tax=Pleomorphomonas carboxyditropha TaxID=2023338 RepID=A0A2G9WWT5_9HYPH|nr:A/G-specific adenine glycosylase [Pleomorphomonas carboxyditropha]PIO98762.1 A/G-specific adenine glycosylase [Pleomorphomonas carboxyditropha]
MPAPSATALLDWYDVHARRLPWRVPPEDRALGVLPDPYRVWLSEVMLQQTTVAAVKSYFLDFLARWPTLPALAAAPRDDVMAAWAGLGYYSRARNLKACAEAVARDHGGRFPDTVEGLAALPGIGPYTAAAIAAIAFDVPAAVVDGNVERVVARLFALETPLPDVKPEIRRLTATLTPQQRPGDFAQAMMDLGATICTPKRPACALCPWSAPCLARRRGDAETLPRRRAKAERPTRYGVAFVARRHDDALLVRRRPDKGLLGGMLEVPGGDWREGAPPEAAPPFPADWKTAGEVEHTFTHFHLVLSVKMAEVGDRPPPAGCFWLDAAAVAGEALPSVMRKVVEAATDRPARRQSRHARNVLAPKRTIFDR